MVARKPVVVEVRLLSIPEAAGALGCSENHIYRLIADGELDTIDIAPAGSRRPKSRVTPEAITEYIDRKRRAS